MGLGSARRVQTFFCLQVEHFELLKEGLHLESDGTVKLPERPGLGIELDRGAVDRYRVA